MVPHLVSLNLPMLAKNRRLRIGNDDFMMWIFSFSLPVRIR